MYGDQFFANSFWNVPEAYDDEFVRVYRLSDLRLSCESPAIDIPFVNQFLQSPWAVPGHRASIISIHPSHSLDAKLLNYLRSLFSDWEMFLPVFVDNDVPMMQDADEQLISLAEVAESNQIIYLLYNSLEANPSMLQRRLSLYEFNLCQRLNYDDASVMERYARREYDCELFASSDAFRVEYDSGLRLENLLVDFGPSSIDLQFYWSNLPRERQSISVQVFNGSGTKIHNQDATIALASLARQNLDVSALEPGDYDVKLIVYDFATRLTVPGIRSSDGSRFERMLEVTAFERN